MKSFVKLCTHALEAFTAALLLVLTVMVFTNVVLRYGFNSGITVTEELGRYLFVWLVFGGAILAAGSDTHVRVDIFVRNLPKIPKTVVAIVCDAIMLYCCTLIVRGGWTQAMLNMDNKLAVSKLPVGWLYMAGFLAGVFIGLILLARLIALCVSLASGKDVKAGGEEAKGYQE